MYAQSVRHVQQMAEFHLSPAFHPLDGAAIKLRRLGEGFLGHVHVQPAHADAVPDRPAGVEHPLRLIGWHATNRLPTMIISQQQI